MKISIKMSLFHIYLFSFKKNYVYIVLEKRVDFFYFLGYGILEKLNRHEIEWREDL